MTLLIAGIVGGLLIYLMSHIYKKNWDRNLTIQTSFGENHCTEGEKGTIQEVIINNKKLPIPSLVIKFPVDRSIEYKDSDASDRTDKQYRADCILARAYEKVTRTFEVTYTKRGYYTLPIIDVVVPDFMYVSVFARKHKNEAEVYVYPTRSKVPAISFSFHELMGEYLTNRFLYEDPFAWKGIREYAPTDTMNKINWGASAKTGTLMVNQYFDSSHPSVVVYLDMEWDGMLYYEELHEETIRIARSYIELCMAKGIPVRLVTNGRDCKTEKEIRVERQAGNTSIDQYLRQLASIKCKEITRPFAEVLQEERLVSGEVPILIGVSEAEGLQTAFEHHVGKQGYGQWMICCKPQAKGMIQSTTVRVVYGEVQ